MDGMRVKGPASEMYARAVPAMSMRSSNQNVSDVYPRVPSRNYNPEDVPRYYPSMGKLYFNFGMFLLVITLKR